MTYRRAVQIALQTEPGEWSAPALAADLGCSSEWVRKSAADLGVEIVDARVAARRARIAEARRRYAAGQPIESIAREIGVSVALTREYIGIQASRRASPRIEAFLREHPNELGIGELASMFQVSRRLVRHVVARRGLRDLLFRTET